MEEQLNSPVQLPPLPNNPNQVRPDNSPYPYMTPNTGETNNRPPMSREQPVQGEKIASPQSPPQGMPMASQMQAQAPSIVMPMGNQPQVTGQPQNDTNLNPQTANDLDVIEKEWVERAKAIVEQTKSDPYLQEQRVAEMQSDYLKKRYGKELKVEKA